MLSLIYRLVLILALGVYRIKGSSTDYTTERPDSKLNGTAAKSALDGITQKLNEPSAEGKIAKSAFYNDKRLLFIAGLEGTGHHAWNEMVSVCITAGGCHGATDITRALMHFDKDKRLLHGLFGAVDVPVSAQYLGEIYTSMKKVKDQGAEGLHIVGLGSVRSSGMMSYPNYNTEHKALDHPDITILAALAESLDIDFRVIVLQRDAAGALASDVRRGMGGRQEAKILVDNSAVLYAQLQMLDPKFFHCVQYHQMNNLTHAQQQQLGSFLHPSKVAPIMSNMLKKVHYASSNERTYTNARLAAVNNRSPDKTSTTGTATGTTSGTDTGNSLERTQQYEEEIASLNWEYYVQMLSKHLSLINRLCVD